MKWCTLIAKHHELVQLNFHTHFLMVINAFRAKVKFNRHAIRVIYYRFGDCIGKVNKSASNPKMTAIFQVT